MAATPSAVGRDARAPARRRRLLLLVAAAVLGACAAGAAVALWRQSHPAARPAADAAPVTWPAGVRRAPDFRLSDQAGRSVSLAALRGRPVLVTFIDPLCRDFCPLEAKQLNELVRRLPATSRPAIVAVSVNVYGNARANLLQDVQKWRLVPEWRWAVGPRRDLASVWRRYGVQVLVTTKKVAGVAVHQISHTEAAYLVDARGYERALFLWPYRADDVLSVLRNLSPATS